MAVLILPCISYSNPLPDTGQTKCCDDTQEIPCPGPGEPFFGQDGNYTINPPSYTKLDANGNTLPDDTPWPWAMVRDNITGLIWEVKTDDGSIHDKDDTYSRYDAQDVFIAGLNSAKFGGQSDWRLPTVKELVSIVNRGCFNPSINTAYFPNTQPQYHWSSTPDAMNPAYAWSVTFEDGTATDIYPDPDDFAYVRAVRGGQCESFGNFIDNGDGTVTHTGTGLMWQQRGPGAYTWQEALSNCENLSLAGYDDWRLPNIHELQSLVDYGSYNDAIDTLYFPTGGYINLSSTTLANYSTPWVVFFANGGVYGDFFQVYGRTVKAVRGGQCGSFDDADGDCRIDCIDNCISIPNGLNSGTCTKGAVAQPCTSDEQCGVDGFCSMLNEDTDSDYLGDACDNCPDTPNPDQADTYPPQGNAIGDACDCEGNFNCDEDADVDGSDAFIFKADFGRSSVLNSCSTKAPCKGDFNCDHDCDGTDAVLFRQDFGRSSMQNPCPACVTGPWCRYSCTNNDDCPETSYCMKPLGSCDGEGICSGRPGACPAIYDPACGCDGITYSNECFASSEGVNVSHAGECKIR